MLSGQVPNGQEISNSLKRKAVTRTLLCEKIYIELVYLFIYEKDGRQFVYFGRQL